MKGVIHELVTSCRIKPALKRHFRLMRSIKAAIAIEQGATEVQPNLFGRIRRDSSLIVCQCRGISVIAPASQWDMLRGQRPSSAALTGWCLPEQLANGLALRRRERLLFDAKG